MKRDAQAPCMSGQTGMAHAVMNEIAAHLKTLARQNEAASIDLRSLPMTDQDREQLEELLGQGEVSAVIELAGLTEVRETAFSGVWWVRHMAQDEQIAYEEIAITRIPEILKTQSDDIDLASRRIQQLLDSPGQNVLEKEAANG